MTRAVIAVLLLTAGPPVRLTAQDTIPPGYGTLKRDEIVVRFTTGTVEIQFLPLDEHVIRLLATDTYHRAIQPRAGFAYQITSRLIVRGG